jgi:D-aspartate ligase
MSLPTAFVLNHIADPHGKGKILNPSTLAVVRSLGRRKVPVILVTTNRRDAISDSRYSMATEFCPYLHESEEALLQFTLGLAKKYPGRKVLLPAVDECAYFVGKYHDRLSSDFLIPAPDWNAVSRINNKRFQYETAGKLGIPIPETYFPATIDDVIELSKQITHFPYVIKPNVSFEWKLQSARSKARGNKGIRVNNAEELVAQAREVFLPGHEFMVQEMIGGRDERLVTFLGYFTESHEPDSYFIRKKMRQCPIDFGYCTMTESCHNPTVLAQSVALLKEIKYHGIAGVEWKLDPATESYKLIEINGRPVNTTGCAMASGVDLPAIAYFSKIGAPLASVTEWQDGQRWAWLNMDFWAAQQLIAEGRLTFVEWLRSVKGIKADAIFAWDDFWISARYYGGWIGARLLTKLNKLWAIKTYRE